MRFLIRLVVFALVAGGAIAAGYRPVVDYWKERNRPHWKTAKMERGEIILEVNATGTVKPVRSTQIGTFVSGPILPEPELADFNQEVKEGQLLARIDPRIYKAGVDRDQAVLSTRTAEVKRVQALLDQAKADERRALDLREENVDFVSQAEMDQFKYARMSLEAQLEVANASVIQANANLKNSEANLEYTYIRAPEDGMVIDRKIDPGQTLAAQFQTPELFVIARDLRKKIHVYASVDEADIGLITKAQEADQPVRFTVDAWPDDLFEGVIEQIRLSSTELQNVVTYPVIVAAANPDLKLLPGMTASISFQIEKSEDVLKLPNSAIRFYPDEQHVREEDQTILDGAARTRESNEDDSLRMRSATEKAESARRRNRRHVWIAEGDKLRALEITIGISDYRFSELLSGELEEGDELVTGIEPKKKGLW